MLKLTRLIILAIALTGIGCAPTYTIDMATQEVHHIEIRDLRIQEEREGKLLPFGRDFSHVMLADSSFQPNRISILKTRLNERFGTRLTAKRIELRRFRTIQYTAPQTNLDNLIFQGTPLEAIGIPDPNHSWFITSIEITIDGQKFSGFSAVKIPPGIGTMKAAMPHSVLGAIDNLLSNMDN